MALVDDERLERFIQLAKSKGLDKKKKKVYTVSQEWLEEHDRQLMEMWNKKRGDVLVEASSEGFLMFMAISVLILIRDFGWGRVKGDSPAMQKRRIAKFCQCVDEEFNKIYFNRDDKFDINEYVDQIWEYSGVEIVNDRGVRK